VTICGSMAFAREMDELKRQLLKIGHEVTSPPELHRYLEPDHHVDVKAEKVELDVIRLYYDEIQKTDAVLILNNEKNGIPGYIGGNVLIEMAFAHVLEKKMFLMFEIPKMTYSDEIEAMQPIVLDGDLGRIK